jgi:hypothetical protein
VDVDHQEEQRRAIRMGVTQQPAEVDVAHDVLDAREREIDVRRIVHREHDAGQNLEDQREAGERAEVPPVIQVARRGVARANELIHVGEHRQPVLDPADHGVGVLRSVARACVHRACSLLSAA